MSDHEIMPMIAVFNVLRQKALEADKTVASELAAVVRVGEAPEVQVEEMMWGGDYVARLGTLIENAQDLNKQDFYHAVSHQASSTADDPWVENAVYSFFAALKKRNASINADNLGELRDIWERTS